MQGEREECAEFITMVITFFPLPSSKISYTHISFDAVFDETDFTNEIKMYFICNLGKFFLKKADFLALELDFFFRLKVKFKKKDLWHVFEFIAFHKSIIRILFGFQFLLL